MRKTLILFALIFTAGVVSAQTCTKAEKKLCTKADAAKADAETKVASAMTAADIAADADENIVRKECAHSGSISYYKKSVCEKSGKVSMAEVSFDEEAKAFVNVSPKDVMGDKEAKVVKASSESKSATKKACCAGKDGKACCAGKSAKSCSKSKEGA